MAAPLEQLVSSAVNEVEDLVSSAIGKRPDSGDDLGHEKKLRKQL